MNDSPDTRTVSLASSFLSWDDIEEKAKELNIPRSKVVQMALEQMFVNIKKDRFRKNYAEIMSGITFALVVLIFVKALIT